MIKLKRLMLNFVFILSILACNKENNEIVSIKNKLKSEEGTNYKRDYFYNTKGQIDKIVYHYVNYATVDSDYNFIYINDKLMSFETTEFYRKCVFTYNDNKLIKVAKSSKFDDKSGQYINFVDDLFFYYTNSDELVDSISDEFFSLRFSLKYNSAKNVISTSVNYEKAYGIYDFILGELIYDNKKNPYTDLPYALKLCKRLDFNNNNILSQQFWASSYYKANYIFTYEYNEFGYPYKENVDRTFKRYIDNVLTSTKSVPSDKLIKYYQ